MHAGQITMSIIILYRMVKNFGETAIVKHWRKKLWRIDAQKIIIKRLITF